MLAPRLEPLNHAPVLMICSCHIPRVSTGKASQYFIGQVPHSGKHGMRTVEAVMDVVGHLLAEARSFYVDCTIIKLVDLVSSYFEI